VSGPTPGFVSTVFADEYANAVPPTNLNPKVVTTGFATIDPQYALESYAKQYATVQRYQQVIVRNRRAVDISQRVTKMSLSLSTAELSELTINVDDPDFLLLSSGVFVGSPAVTYQGLQLELAGIETDVGARGALILRARSSFVQKLKRRRGPLVVQGGPQAFIGVECGRVGMAYVTDTDQMIPGVQAADYYTRTSRDWQPYVQPTTLQAEDEIPSSWTTFKRLAQERGWLMFESANVLYFAPPSFLFRLSRIVRVRWAGTPDQVRAKPTKLVRSAYGVVVGPDGLQRPQVLTAGGLTAPDVIDCLEPPKCTYSQDQLGVSINFKVASGAEGWFLPGCVVDLSGVPYFDGLYLCNTVNYDLDGPDVTITASTPIDTQAQQGGSTAGGFAASGSQGIGGYALSGSSSAALGLPVCGITMDHFLAGLRAHESGDRNLRPPFRGGPSGYYQYIESTWASWVHEALGQAAADRYPTAHSAPKAVQTQVARFQVTQTQHRFANDWGKSAAYHFYPKLADSPSEWHFVPGQEPGGGGKTNNPRVIDYVRDVLRRANGVACAGGSTARTGTGLSTNFLHMALSQIGDRYVYGASDPVTEANPDSFDCSSLVQWAAGRVGVKLPRFSGDQWQHCRGRALSPRAALDIPGALLFVDSGRVQGGEHVAIAMGDGRRDMAAHSVRLGVGVATTTPGSWDRAALIPGMHYPGIDMIGQPPRGATF
jgi:cell wall-associated NlpC family hydrolase